uniref:type II secretion system F family protein n=1 Tax=Aliarcobacter sp. TaxID=2321116 RepID=UPI004047CD58
MKKYKIKYQDSNKIKEQIITSNNISNEELPLNIISIKELKQNYHFDFFNKKKITDKNINLLFYELNLMLQSNINISDALDILIKNKKDKSIIEFLKAVKYSFANGKEIDENIKEFQINDIVVGFLKNSQNSGNIALNIKALSELINENYLIKKDFYKVISYPIVLLVSFCFSLIAIFTFVIPKFKIIFEQNVNDLPLATDILLQTQYLVENYLLYFVLIVLFIVFSIIYFYKNNASFIYFIDMIIIEKVPLIREIYLNMQLYKLFLVIDIMLKSNYEFHKAFISSKILLKNKYLLDKIRLIDDLLQNGKSINDSFFKTQIFDDIVLNLINTGEVSNSLSITIDEIKKIYKNRFYNKINLLTSLIQPLFLIVIMCLILWIVLAIFMPIWNMGNMINV